MENKLKEKQIEEMAKLDIEKSAGFYSAFINDMRISKNKPLSTSKTIMSFNCPKNYILQAIGIPEDSVVLTHSEFDEFRKDQAEVKFLKNKIINQASNKTAKDILFKFESAFAYYDNEDMFSKKAIFECIEGITKQVVDTKEN